MKEEMIWPPWQSCRQQGWLHWSFVSYRPISPGIGSPAKSLNLKPPIKSCPLAVFTILAIWLFLQLQPFWLFWPFQLAVANYQRHEARFQIKSWDRVLGKLGLGRLGPERFLAANRAPEFFCCGKLGPGKSGPGWLGPCIIYIGIGYVLPTIGGYMSVEFIYWYWIYSANNWRIYVNWRDPPGGCLCALWPQGWRMCVCFF